MANRVVQLFSRQTPLDVCLKTISKGDESKFKKSLKSVNVHKLFPWQFHKWELIHLIHYICSRGNIAILKTFLFEVDENAIHKKTHSGWTTLHFAVNFSNYDVIDELLSRGVDVDATETISGFSALHLAIEKRNMGAVKRLVEGLADLNLPAAKPDGPGLTPKELAEKKEAKQIIMFIDEFEGKNRMEKNMQRLAERNADLEAKLENIGNEMDDKLRQQKAQFDADIKKKLESVQLGHTPKIPPPIPPRKKHNSMSASNSQLSPAQNTSTPIPSPGPFRTKEEWLNSQAIASAIDHSVPASRRVSAGQLHFHFHSYGSNQSLARRSNLDLTNEVFASGQTSGIGSQLDIPEEEDTLSQEARSRILRNFDRFIYYLRYDKLSPALIAKGVLTLVDIENLSRVDLTNSQRIAYIFNEVILKGTNNTLRLFLEALEENDYTVHANTIRATSVLDKYPGTTTQRNMKSKSMSHVNKNGYQALTLGEEDTC